MKKSLFLSWPLSSKAALGPLGARSSLFPALTASHGPFRAGRGSTADGTARRPCPAHRGAVIAGEAALLAAPNGDPWSRRLPLEGSSGKYPETAIPVKRDGCFNSWSANFTLKLKLSVIRWPAW